MGLSCRLPLLVAGLLAASLGCGRTPLGLAELDESRGGSSGAETPNAGDSGSSAQGGSNGGTGIGGAVGIGGGAGVEARGGSPGGGGAGGFCMWQVDAVVPTPNSVLVPTTTDIGLDVGCPDLEPFELVMTARGRNVEGTVVRNGSHDIEFVPSRKLSLATYYDVELRRAGEMLYSWDFRTRDGAWGDPVLVRELTGRQYLVALGLSRSGEGVVAFSEENSGNYTTVSARRFTTSSDLGAAETVDEQRYSDAHDLAVGVDDAGRAVVAWTAYGDGGNIGSYEILSAFGSKDSAWSHPAIVLGPANRSLRLCDAAARRTGEKPLLWLDESRLSVFDAERPSAVPAFVGDAASLDSAALLLGDEGDLWVAWSSGPAFARHRNQDAMWSDVELIGDSRRGLPRLATSASGTALVAFKTGTPSETLLVRHHEPANGWGSPIPLRVEGGRGTMSFQSHTVALDALGDGLVLWAASIAPAADGGVPETISEVRAQRYTVERSWTTGSQTLALGALGAESLVLDPLGNGFAAGTYEGRAVAVRFIAVTGFKLAERIGEDATRPPELAVDDTGRAVALWLSGPNLWLARFDERE